MANVRCTRAVPDSTAAKMERVWPSALPKQALRGPGWPVEAEAVEAEAVEAEAETFQTQSMLAFVPLTAACVAAVDCCECTH